MILGCKHAAIMSNYPCPHHPYEADVIYVPEGLHPGYAPRLRPGEPDIRNMDVHTAAVALGQSMLSAMSNIPPQTAPEYIVEAETLLHAVEHQTTERPVTVDNPTERMLLAQLQVQVASAISLHSIAQSLALLAQDKIGWTPPGQAKDKHD